MTTTEQRASGMLSTEDITWMRRLLQSTLKSFPTDLYEYPGLAGLVLFWPASLLVEQLAAHVMADWGTRYIHAKPDAICAVLEQLHLTDRKVWFMKVWERFLETYPKGSAIALMLEPAFPVPLLGDVEMGAVAELCASIRAKCSNRLANILCGIVETAPSVLQMVMESVGAPPSDWRSRPVEGEAFPVFGPSSRVPRATAK